MARMTLEMLLMTAIDEPPRLKSEADRLRMQILAQRAAVKTRIEAAERLSFNWKEYLEERRKADEQLTLARAQYKEVLKRTENAALSGQPRLYWFAKSMFAKLRRHSLEYQVSESQQKLSALELAFAKLNSLVGKLGVNPKNKELSHLFNFEDAERASSDHSKVMTELWVRVEQTDREMQKLQKKLANLDVTSANFAALVSGAKTVAGLFPYSRQARIVDSEIMLTSRLPFVGFVNKTKLTAQIEQGEYAAEHAERDLQKVREGIKMASEAAVGGRPTRMTRDWLDYCKTIVCRYDEHFVEPSTHG